MNTIGIDWNEVILLVIGALVGICSSVAMIFIQNVNEKYGKMCIYTKFNCLKNMGREGWGREEKRGALPPFFRNVSPTFPRVSLSENATVWPFLVKSVALRYRFRVLRYRYFERTNRAL